MSMADISEFTATECKCWLLRKEQTATALELGPDIPFSPSKHRPFVALLSQVMYLSPLGNVAHGMGSETVREQKRQMATTEE